MFVIPLSGGRRSFQYESERIRQALGVGAPSFVRPSGPESTQPTRFHGETGALNYADYSPVHPETDSSSHVEGRSGGGRRGGGGNTTEWVKQQRDLFFRVEKELGGMKNVESEERTLAEAAKKSGMALSASRRHLQQAENAVTKAEKSIEDASRVGFTKRFRKDKYEKEVAEGEAAKEKAQSQVIKFSKEVEMFRRSDDDMNKRHAQAQKNVIRKKQLLSQKKEVLFNLFSGMHAGDEAENKCELKRNQIRQRKAKNKAALVDAMRGLSHITAAVRSMENVLRLLRSAISSNTMDLYTSGNMGFGQMAARQTLMNMNRAAQLAKNANVEMDKAKQCSPHMPTPPKAQVKQSTFGFMQLFSDSTFSDMRQRYKIQKQLTSSQVVYQQTVKAMRWQEKFVNEIRIDLRKVEMELQQAEQELMAHRIRLIKLPVA
eukprot:Plantae.Rhodophyta-Hildenbrandia_rubra.ctg12031.p1 GENE.Plantae.Rhodophyta-Hildenbrandia_rubra.ctg12031~~Plantae.Rhodophyta-Hildenbrandia_rubra.ctg12031.p1  ORF type:complete len:432 (+),score=106.85 Plantae.Rhodophyta-Hildenbrandia_rubra.ctg12031:151-1446(+)